MAKGMPRTALRPNHPKHPSGIHVLYDVRRNIRDQLDKSSAAFRQAWSSTQPVQQYLQSTIDWMTGPAGLPPSPEQHEYLFVRIVNSMLSRTIASYVALRYMQIEVNNIRTLLAKREYDLERICCHQKDHFIQETCGFASIVQAELLRLFRCLTPLLPSTNSGDFVTIPRDFWDRVGNINPYELIERDNTLAIMYDIVRAKEIHELGDPFGALVQCLLEAPTEKTRFDPMGLPGVLDLIQVFLSLLECVDRLFDGGPCSNHAPCEKWACGLHTFVPQLYTEPVNILDLNSDLSYHFAAAWKGCNNVFEQPYPANIFFKFAVSQIVERFKRSRHSRCSPFCDLVDEFIGMEEMRKGVDTEKGTNTEKTDLHPAETNAQVPPSAIPVPPPHTPVALPSSTPATTALRSTMAPSLDVSMPFRNNATATSRTDDSEPYYKELRPANPTDTDLGNKTITPVRVLPDETVATSSISTASAAQDVWSSGSTRPPKVTTTAKYERKGYGKTFESPSPAKSGEDIADRKWIIRSRDDYHDIWRVIFPITRVERQMSRISWPRFKRAMLSSPLDCKLKKEDGVIHVFVRNEGKELFSCHAPHDLTWIPAIHLYRYRKDLQTIFGMSTGNILLKGAETRESTRRHGKCCC